LPRIDLHVHSSASFDCQVAPLDVARRCHALGLSPVVLTDHDSIEGAKELKGSGINVIAGQEVMTTEGELIGLFLTAPIPGKLSPESAVKAIKDQGGVVYLEHPYDEYRRRLSEAAIERLADAIDIVEVWNGRASPEANAKAADLCETLGAAPGAGSDAHRLDEIGRAYVELEPFDSPSEFIERLKHGRVVVNPNRLLLRAKALLSPRSS
jgi:predicted metal-dependent phosphoesterase TrpH